MVEVVPYNLLQYSNVFNNGVWSVGSTITLTSGQVGYDGTNNAWLLSKGALQYPALGQSVSSSGTKTLSIYAKANTNTKISLLCNSSPSSFYQDFNLSNGTLGPDSFGVVNALIESVGNGWYRCSVVFSGDTTSFIVFPDNIEGANAGSVYIQNAQIVSGSVAKEYLRTETRLNIPRLDYTNGTCPSILVEPQRTNLLLRSQEFGTSPWAFGGVLDTISANSIISPDGTQNADTFVCGYTGYSSIYQSATTTSGTLYTFSVFAKKGNQNKLSIELRGADTTPNIVFDLNNGTILSGSGGTITSVGNGWYKCTLTKLSNSTSTLIIIGRGLTGSIGDTFNLYGAQLEAGNYATSYIPTVDASVTRNADVISKTGISSLIGQTEGTILFEINAPNPNSPSGVTMIQLGSGTSRIYIGKESSTQNIFQLATQSASGYNFINSSIITTSTIKFAIAYKNGDNAFYVNGALVSSASATANPTSFSQINFGDTSFGNTDIKVKSTTLWKTRLSNDQLAQLTTI